MTQRIAALAFIFFCTSMAWMILGATIASRTHSVTPDLKSKVAQTWGTPQTQRPPLASYRRIWTTTDEQVVDGKKITRTVEHSESIPLPLVATRATVDFNLDHRQKGLLWYSTYGVLFSGDYTFVNESDKPQTVTFDFPLPSHEAMYDDLQMAINGEPYKVNNVGNSVATVAEVPRQVLRHPSHRIPEPGDGQLALPLRRLRHPSQRFLPRHAHQFQGL